MGAMRPRVLIVDDHVGFVAEARQLLEADGFEVVGEAADGQTGNELAADVEPDLVLVDIGLPDMDGFALAQLIVVAAPRSRIILISSRDQSTYGRRVDDAPAIGFLRKDVMSGSAIRRLVEIADSESG
jgi:DNA-binding NarL/FixJ family response regulator